MRNTQIASLPAQADLRAKRSKPGFTSGSTILRVCPGWSGLAPSKKEGQ